MVQYAYPVIPTADCLSWLSPIWLTHYWAFFTSSGSLKYTLSCKRDNLHCAFLQRGGAINNSVHNPNVVTGGKTHISIDNLSKCLAQVKLKQSTQVADWCSASKRSKADNAVALVSLCKGGKIDQLSTHACMFHKSSPKDVWHKESV